MAKKMCQECEQPTNKRHLLPDGRRVCRECMKEYEDRLDLGFAMLGMSDDSVESSYFDEEEES